LGKVDWDKGMEFIVDNKEGTIPLLGYSVTSCQVRIGMILRQFTGDYKLKHSQVSVQEQDDNLFITVNYEMSKIK
jgi:hypothetical protein